MIRSGIQIIPHGRLSKSIVFVMVGTKEINPTAHSDHSHTILIRSPGWVRLDSYTADTGMIYFMCFIAFWFSCIRQIRLPPKMESAFASRAMSFDSPLECAAQQPGKIRKSWTKIKDYYWDFSAQKKKLKGPDNGKGASLFYQKTQKIYRRLEIYLINKFSSRHGLIVEKFGAALQEMRLAIQAWIAPSYPYITYLLHSVVFQLYLGTCAHTILFWVRALFVYLFNWRAHLVRLLTY